ncbi:MAG: cytochrome [Sphingobium sp. 32-64-5]|nr:MAG: cytochrome [Sphingobium sp. 32-64-5]
MTANHPTHATEAITGAPIDQPAAGVPRLDIDPFDEAFLRDPYAWHGALREAGPVVWLNRYGVYASARYDEVAGALNDWHNFLSGRGVGLSDFAREKPWRPPSLLLEADPPLHDRTRRIMAGVVSLPRLRAVAPLWREKAAQLVDELMARPHFDAITDMAEIFPLRIFPQAVGLGPQAQEHLLSYAAATFNAFGPRNAIFEASNARAQDAIAWVDRACRRENLLDDGWGMEIYRAADAGECTPDEAHRLVRSLLSAGVDTTVNGIGNMVHAFALHPEQWTILRETPALRKKAFEEALRWDSTVQTFFRTTGAPVELGGVALPEGAKILLFLAAANRDPRRWDEPDRFDIRRHASGHVGFGFGIHQCLGQMVARLEAEAMLDALVPRVARFRLRGEPVRRLNNTLHALASLPVEIEAAQ